MSDRADRLGKWLAAGGSVAVAAVVALTIATTGTPAEQRRVRIDAMRIRDLQLLETAVDSWVNQHNGLPTTIDDMAKAPGASLPVEDRDGRGRYEYARVDPRHYLLCAEFDTDTALVRSDEWPANTGDWNHAVGRQCFTREVKKKVD